MSISSFLLIFGGSFNPPHCGHMRIAIECAEAFAPAPLLFVPSAVPPHKSAEGLLPFALRCAMLRACLDCLEDDKLRGRLLLDEVEREREGPSFTVDTLRILAARHPELRPVFILGSEDYERLTSWKDWACLPEHADLLVVPRSAGARENFAAHTPRLWAGAAPMDEAARRGAGLPDSVEAAFMLPGGGRLLYLPQPLFDVSSSLVRERRSQGRSLDFLLPGPVREMLDRYDAGLGSRP